MVVRGSCEEQAVVGSRLVFEQFTEAVSWFLYLRAWFLPTCIHRPSIEMKELIPAMKYLTIWNGKRGESGRINEG